jgi:RimJ/RimL family protein N-acetyltransferase
MMSEPTIFMETPRLWLRPFTQADIHPFVAMRSDPVIARYQSWSDFTEADGYLFILDMAQTQPGIPGEWYQFAVALRDTNIFIGDCALFTGEDGRSGEIGYTFARAHQRQGYATEAVTAVLNYAFHTLHLQQIMATADGRNIASIKLLQRLGFQQEKQETVWFKGQRVRENSYMLTKENWEKHI